MINVKATNKLFLIFGSLIIKMIDKRYLFALFGLILMSFLGISTLLPEGENEVQKNIIKILPTITKALAAICFVISAIGWFATKDKK